MTSVRVPSSVRVLLVEDDEDDALLLERLLTRVLGVPFVVRRASLLREALELLGAEPVDVVLLDLGLPDATGLSGLDSMLAAAPTVPIVVLTGAGSEDLAAQALQRGAEDFLVKGEVGSDGLARSLRYALARKRAEEALRRTHEQLRTSQKMEAIGRLAGGMAHDFNGVLTAILGYADLLLEQTPPDDPRHDDVEQIRRAGERAASLTRQVLAFSRHDVIRPQVLAFDVVVGDLSKMLRRLIGGHIELRLELEAPGACVHADPSQLEQVVMNLVLNARDALPQGGTIIVRTRCVQAGAGSPASEDRATAGEPVRLEVEDTGTGMTPETMKRIFEPFFTTKEIGKGTGLGLSTVHRIVGQMGGAIEAESVLGEGSVLRVRLPRTQGCPDVVAEEDSGPPPPGTETILVADDDEGVRSLARRVLERHGYRVLEAATAAEALLVATHHDGPIHLLLTDLVLPGMSGCDLAERIRRARIETRVLYSSGYVASETPPFGLDLRSSYLQKPYRPDVLAREVRTALDTR